MRVKCFVAIFLRLSVVALVASYSNLYIEYKRSLPEDASLVFNAVC